MIELKMCGMKGDSIDSPLLSRVIFSVSDDWMANCQELHPDLVLQSRNQSNPHE